MTTEENTGAAKYRAKRRRVWAVMGTMTVLSIILGYIAGAYVGYADGMGAPVQDYVSPPMAWALVALWLLVLCGTAIFASKNTDEVELQQSYWASAVAIGFYFCVYTSWQALYWLGAAPAVDGLIVFGATWTVFMLAYLGHRYWPR